MANNGKPNAWTPREFNFFRDFQIRLTASLKDPIHFRSSDVESVASINSELCVDILIDPSARAFRCNDREADAVRDANCLLNVHVNVHSVHSIRFSQAVINRETV